MGGEFGEGLAEAERRLRAVTAQVCASVHGDDAAVYSDSASIHSGIAAVYCHDSATALAVVWC